jgi:polysaccharide biosynthesis transport protein
MPSHRFPRGKFMDGRQKLFLQERSMNTPTTNAPLPWKFWLGILKRYSPLWLGCAVASGALGVAYGLVRSPQWLAAQPLVIRDEAGASFERLGRFASQTEMKAAQETVLEMARNEDVIRAALIEIGPPPNHSSDELWPSKKIIETVAEKSISVRPPKGAEFGSTEVLYLESEAETPERAKRLCTTVLENVRERLRTLRRVRADSIVAELTDARGQSLRQLDDVTEKIRTIEAEVGADLGELRSMTEAGGVDGAMRRSLVEVQSELQVAELELGRLTGLRNMLQLGQEDPGQLVLAGEDLLNLQPTLKRLKDGLIDAQLQRSQLSGRYTREHPKMRGAELAELEIRERLAQEIQVAVNAMHPRLATATDRVERLQSKQADLTTRLGRLATIRSDYLNLSVQLRQRSEALAVADRSLSEAESLRMASDSTNFVEALGPPQVADDPVGPGTSIFALGAAASGSLLGFGLVFLIAPAPSGQSFGRRWSDYAFGRRSSDSAGSTPVPAVSPEAAAFASRGVPGRRAADANLNAESAAANTAPPTAAELERRRRPRQPPSNLFGKETNTPL